MPNVIPNLVETRLPKDARRAVGASLQFEDKKVVYAGFGMSLLKISSQ